MIVLYNRWWLCDGWGLTIKPFIFLADSREVIKEQQWKFLHEERHYIQQSRHGLIKFLFIWLRDLLTNYWSGMTWKQAYLNIPFEVEAREVTGG